LGREDGKVIILLAIILSYFKGNYTGSMIASCRLLLVDRTGFVKERFHFRMSPFKIYVLVAELKISKELK
jgi:hypothetical protein